MKRIIVVALATLMGGYAVAHYLIAAKIDQRLDQLAAGLEPVGNLTHGSIWISPTGVASINHLVFYPYGTSADAQVNRVLVRADSLKSLYDLSQDLTAGRVPQQLSLSLEGVTFDVGTAVFESLSQDVDNRPAVDFFASGCGDRSRFSYADLDAMGYQNHVSDITFGYRLSADETQLTVTGDVASREKFKVSYSLDFELSPESITHPQAALNGFRLRRFAFALEDQGYAEQVIQFCAHQAGLGREAYLAHHLQAWRDSWREVFITPGDGWVAAYREFLQQPGSISLQAFADLTVPEAMTFTTGAALLERVNPQISVNQGNPRPFRFDFAQSDWQARQQAGRQIKRTESVPDDATGVAEERPAASLPVRRVLELDELETHLNKTVAIEMSDGRVFQGEILEISEFEPKSLQLRQSIHNGTMIMPLKLELIARIHLL